MHSHPSVSLALGFDFQCGEVIHMKELQLSHNVSPRPNFERRRPAPGLCSLGPAISPSPVMRSWLRPLGSLA
jgi:hypothetical protein